MTEVLIIGWIWIIIRDRRINFSLIFKANVIKYGRVKSGQTVFLPVFRYAGCNIKIQKDEVNIWLE